LQLFKEITITFVLGIFSHAVDEDPSPSWICHECCLYRISTYAKFKKSYCIFICCSILTKQTRSSVGWACVTHLSFCFEET